MTKARDTANLTGSGVTLPLLDIDAGTDIGAALVDADLMIVDDGAGGTNRKATMSRLATYMGTKIGGGLEFVSSSGAISNAATVAFTGFDSSKYDHYVFWLQHVIPATDNVTFWAQSSTNTGSAYSSSSGDYHYNNLTDGIGFPVSATNVVGSDTNEGGCNGPFYLYAPHNTANYTHGNCSLVNVITTNGGVALGGGSYGSSYRVAAEDVDAIRFIFSSGNIESGEITMFGIVNS
jgi:hypothetical protein